MRDIDSEIVAESFEEHGVVEELLNELATMNLEEAQFEAKFKVMSENVEHHIEEEEREMFPKCKRISDYEGLSERMAKRKQELMEELESQGDSSERATGDAPATRMASQKSEEVLADASAAGSKDAESRDGKEAKKEAQRPARETGRSRRARRGAASSGRR